MKIKATLLTCANCNFGQPAQLYSQVPRGWSEIHISRTEEESRVKRILFCDNLACRESIKDFVIGFKSPKQDYIAGKTEVTYKCMFCGIEHKTIAAPPEQIPFGNSSFRKWVTLSTIGIRVTDSEYLDDVVCPKCVETRIRSSILKPEVQKVKIH